MISLGLFIRSLVSEFFDPLSCMLFTDLETGNLELFGKFLLRYLGLHWGGFVARFLLELYLKILERNTYLFRTDSSFETKLSVIIE